MSRRSVRVALICLVAVAGVSACGGPSQGDSAACEIFIRYAEQSSAAGEAMVQEADSGPDSPAARAFSDVSASYPAVVDEALDRAEDSELIAIFAAHKVAAPTTSYPGGLYAQDGREILDRCRTLGVEVDDEIYQEHVPGG